MSVKSCLSTTGSELSVCACVCVCQGADPAGEGGGGDPSAPGGEQVGPGGPAAGLCRRGRGEGERVGRPVRGDVGQDEGERRQGTQTPTFNQRRR